MKADRSYIKLRIREAMAEAGVSVKELASRMGCTKAYVYLLRDGRSMSLNSLIRVAIALDIPFTSLFEK